MSQSHPYCLTGEKSTTKKQKTTEHLVPKMDRIMGSQRLILNKFKIRQSVIVVGN